MNILMFEPRAKKVTFAADNMWVEFTDGRQLGVPLAYFPRLLNAAQRQRDNYTIYIGRNSDGFFAIMWRGPI